MADENKPQFARDPELERAKAWWDEHGKAIVVGIVIGLSAVVGFNFWQNYQQTRAEAASVLFERLRGEIETATATATGSEAEGEVETATETDTDTVIDAETEAAIQAMAGELMADYDATPYATHAAFALAKFAVESGDLDEAARALRWVLDNGDDAGLQHIARLRLASVLLARGEADAALVVLQAQDAAGFAARYNELIGDAYLQKDDTAAARSAYESSAEMLPPSSIERALLQLKLDDLGG